MNGALLFGCPDWLSWHGLTRVPPFGNKTLLGHIELVMIFSEMDNCSRLWYWTHLYPFTECPDKEGHPEYGLTVCFLIPRLYIKRSYRDREIGKQR